MHELGLIFPILLDDVGDHHIALQKHRGLPSLALAAVQCTPSQAPLYCDPPSPSQPLLKLRVGRERTFTAENHRFRRYLLLSLVARQSPGIDCPNVLLWRPNIWALLI